MDINMTGEALEPQLNGEKYRWLKGQLKPDLLDLDEEISRISVLVQEANENSAMANEIRDAAKEGLSVQTARAAARLRGEPLSSGKTRSEAQIESELPLCPEHQKALEEYGNARLDAALWMSMVQGYSTKAYSLSTAAELIKMGYITKDAIIEKRRKDIRNVSAPVIHRREVGKTE